MLALASSIRPTNRVHPPVLEAPMDTDLSRVIVTTAEAHRLRWSITVISPRSAARGGQPKEAASNLVNKLACTLDSALTDWRRETIDHAIADVKAFVAQKEDVPARDH